MKSKEQGTVSKRLKMAQIEINTLKNHTLYFSGIKHLELRSASYIMLTTIWENQT